MASIKQAEKMAASLLEQHHAVRPPIDVEGIAKALGASIRLEQLEPNVSGLLVRSPDGRVVIGVNAQHHLNRRRFTIAHEIGHFVLHKTTPGVFIDEHMVHFRADASARQTDPKEVEANFFAAALLLPKELLVADVRERQLDAMDEVALKALAERYAVSQQTLTLRLLNLGLLAGMQASSRVARLCGRVRRLLRLLRRQPPISPPLRLRRSQLRPPTTQADPDRFEDERVRTALGEDRVRSRLEGVVRNGVNVGPNDFGDVDWVRALRTRRVNVEDVDPSPRVGGRAGVSEAVGAVRHALEFGRAEMTLPAIPDSGGNGERSADAGAMPCQAELQEHLVQSPLEHIRDVRAFDFLGDPATFWRTIPWKPAAWRRSASSRSFTAWL